MCLAAVGELSAGIAHEIRNPLAAISGSVQMLQDNPRLDDHERRLLDIVVKESDYLNGLITDFLAYARPSTMEIGAVNVVQLISETLQMCVAGASVPVVTKLSGRSDAWAKGDRRQLRQVLWNLFTNAIDAMPSGGSIHVDVQLNAMPQNEVLIAVSDTGGGIPDDLIDRIFTPFFTTKERGTGLGLATVHAIVELHGGKIAVESSESGTTFRVALPANRAASDHDDESPMRGEAA